MQVTLTSTCKHKKPHTINVVTLNDKLILTTPDGKPICELQTQTMERDVKDDSGAWSCEPTENFYVQFVVHSQCGLGNAATGIVEDIKPQ